MLQQNLAQITFVITEIASKNFQYHSQDNLL